MKKKVDLGFTYLGLMFFLAIMGITLAMAGTLWSFAQQREKERELLFAGNQYRQAIGMYYQRTPGVIKRYPSSLKDLLQDNRYVSLQRYLRRMYADPITGSSEWGLIAAPDGGIMGVYSKSKARSIKTGNFQFKNILMEDQEKYYEWKFVYVPKGEAYLPVK